MLLVVISWLAIVRQYYPVAGIAVTGTLTLKSNELVLRLGQDADQQLDLGPAGPPIIIRYEGYAGEQVGRVSFEGTENFISIDNSPLHRFWIPDDSVTMGLQALLSSWYARKIPVKEYCQDSRTFLLERNLSYEQIQAYKREFGVSLYS